MKAEYEIVIDTREQLPFWDNCERKKLNVGDYSLKGYEDIISLERKSTGDLFGTCGAGHKRFHKELERAKTLKYFAIVVEGSYDDIATKDFPNSHMTKMKGYIVNSIIFTIHMKYNIPIFLCKNRTEAKHVTRQLLTTYYNLYKIDTTK